MPEQHALPLAIQFLGEKNIQQVADFTDRRVLVNHNDCDGEARSYGILCDEGVVSLAVFDLITKDDDGTLAVYTASSAVGQTVCAKLAADDIGRLLGRISMLEDSGSRLAMSHLRSAAELLDNR